MSVHAAAQPIGNLLRDWRQRRRFSQLDLACEAEISQRHLSFIESGRSTPSREMILHLAEQLDVPLRERNAMLLAAGYAPTFAERTLDDPGDGGSAPGARRHPEGPRTLSGARGGPPLDADRRQCVACRRSWPASSRSCWSRRSTSCGSAFIPADLRRESSISDAWRAHAVERLRRQHRATGDKEIEALLREISGLSICRTGQRTRKSRRTWPGFGCRRAAEIAHGCRAAVISQHDDHIRHRGRDHLVRAGA